METVLLGWPSDGPTLRLDYRQFRYAGKFVMSTTGKAVIRNERETSNDESDHPQSGELDHPQSGESNRPQDGESDHPQDGEANRPEDDYATDVLAAVAFDEDRTDQGTLRIRYVTVRDDRRGERLGPHLCAFTADRAGERGYERVRIAVNNPFAYEACYRAGFAYIGEETGLAELVLERPTATVAPDRSAATYQAGLDRYRDRDLSTAEVAFLERNAGSTPPEPLADVE